MGITLHTKPLYAVWGTNDVCTIAYKTRSMRKGYCDEPHTYDALKFVRVTSGSGIWNVNGKDYIVTVGDVLAFSQFDSRFIKEVTASDAMQIEQVEFMPVALYPWQSCADFFFSKDVSVLPRESVHHPCILRGFDDIKREALGKDAYKNAAITHLLIGMVIDAARSVGAAPGVMSRSSQYEMVCDTMKFINEHLNEPLTREGLAARCFVSPAHFSRMFKEYSGICLQQYVTECRVAAAVKMLKSTDRSVLDIAFSCGFSSSSGFYKTFKRRTGKDPCSYRHK